MLATPSTNEPSDIASLEENRQARYAPFLSKNKSLFSRPSAQPGQFIQKEFEEELNEAARRALQGDPSAQRNFLHAISPMVRGICRGVTGRDFLDLEDTIQDCLFDVVRALPHFRFESDVSHYITRITMRRAIAARQRSRDHAKKHTVVDVHKLSAETEDTQLEARLALVRNLLDQISGAQATVLRLRLMLGHSIEEIASITGVSVNTVKTRLRLGKIQLRRRLAYNGEKTGARHR